MSEKQIDLETHRSLNSKSASMELLDIYTQMKKLQLNRPSSQTLRTSLRKSQKLLRLTELNLNSNTPKTTEKVDEKINNINDQKKPRNRARIIKLKWDPDEDNQREKESNSEETLTQPIMKASGRDRRKLWT